MSTLLLSVVYGKLSTSFLSHSLHKRGKPRDEMASKEGEVMGNLLFNSCPILCYTEIRLE